MKARLALFVLGFRVAAMSSKTPQIQYVRVKNEGEPCHELKYGASAT
jgi:hypothetical protein